MTPFTDMTPYPQDSLQVLMVKIAYWMQTVSSGGSGGGAGYTFGNYGAGDAIPVNGSITTQQVWNTATNHSFVNTAWPNTAAPTWVAH